MKNRLKLNSDKYKFERMQIRLKQSVLPNKFISNKNSMQCVLELFHASQKICKN